MSRKILVLAALVAVLGVGAWYLFLWSPAGEDLSTAQDRRDQAESEEGTLGQQLTRLQSLAEQRPEMQSELESLRAAVPEDPGLADVLLAVDDAARASGVDFTTVSATEPTELDEFGLGALSLQIAGDGGYFQVIDFVNRLNRVHRVLTVETLNLSAVSATDAALGPPDITYAMSISAYVSATVDVTGAEATTEAPADGSTDAADTTADTPGGVEATEVSTTEEGAE